MPMNPVYQNQLQNLVQNPSSFTSDPGYQFGLDNALNATQRGMASNRGSGNALAALAQTGAGYAGQQYGQRVDQLGKLAGQEETYDLGLGQNANTATRNANDLTLGTQANTNTANRNNQDFGLGMYTAGNNFALGQQGNANTAQNNYWNYQLGRGQNANTSQANANNFDINWMNANTQRGNAQSEDYWRNPQNLNRRPMSATGY